MKSLIQFSMVLLMVASSGAWAEQQVREQRPLAPQGKVILENVAGEVHVEAWDKHSVLLEGELADALSGVKISGDEQRLEIEVKYPRKKRYSGGAELYLKIPVGAALEVVTVSADIQVGGLRGSDLRLQSVSGDVSVSASPTELELETVSGEVDASVDAERVEVESVSGEVEVRGQIEELGAHTVSGDMQLEIQGLYRGRVNTTSGDMEISSSLVSRARLQIESTSGDVEIGLRGQDQVSARVETFSGDIRSALGEVRENRYGPQQYLDYKGKNSDSAKLEIATLSGDVQIRR